MHLTPQNDKLMSKRRVLGFKPALRLEWRGQDGQHETQQAGVVFLIKRTLRYIFAGFTVTLS